MKKLVLLSTIFLSTIASASTEECLERTQSAVSPDGVCTHFETACEIPSDWKVVPTCDLIKEKSFGISLEDRMKKRSYGRRYTGIFTASKKETKEVKTGAKFRRQGSGYLTRTGSYRSTRLNESQGAGFRSRRTVTQKDYSKATREKIKRLNIQKGGYQHEGDLTKEERKARRAYRAPIQSATQMNRSGYLSSKQKFSTEVEKRSAAAQIGSERVWKGLKYVTRKKKKRVYEGPQLRRLWRGNRLEGNLE